MNRERILITGGAGFIGSHTVDLLLEQGKSIIILDDLSTGKLANLDTQHPNLRFIAGDVLDLHLIGNLISDCDAVMHLAAIASVPRSIEDPLHTAQVNKIGTLTILEAIRQAKKPIRFVYASSSAVYGDCVNLPCTETMSDLIPTSPYALQKSQCEQYAALYARNYGIKSLGLRYFNVYGLRQDPTSPYSGVISLFLDAYKNDQEFKIFGDGQQSRDFVFVADVAKVNAIALNTDVEGVLNVGTGKTQTLMDLVTCIEQVGKQQAKYKLAPPRDGDIRHSYGDVSKLTASLKFKPQTTLQEGIAALMSSFK